MTYRRTKPKGKCPKCGRKLTRVKFDASNDSYCTKCDSYPWFETEKVKGYRKGKKKIKGYTRRPRGTMWDIGI